MKPVESNEAKGHEGAVLASLFALTAFWGCLDLALCLSLVLLARSLSLVVPLDVLLPGPPDVSETAKTRSPSYPSPSPSSPPIPSVLVYNGEKNAYFEIDQWAGRALLYVRYDGQGYFSVTCYDPFNFHTTSLDTEGPYEGVLPLDFFRDKYTTHISVQAAGPWRIEIRPLDMIERLTVPGRLEGRTDRVIRLEGEPAVELTVSTGGYIGTWGCEDSYPRSRAYLLVNDYPRDPSPITVTAEIPPGVTMLSIKATDEWTMVISGRSL